jgi:hypothetical protein
LRTVSKKEEMIAVRISKRKEEQRFVKKKSTDK